MGFQDHQRGVRDGYSSLPIAPAANADEARGRAEGQNQRLADDARRRQAADGSAGEHLPFRYALLGLGLLVAWLFGVRLVPLLMLGLGALGLVATPKVRPLLRQATPVYVGALIGVCTTAVSLLGSGAPLIADNLVIYPALGAAGGAVYAVVQWLLRRRRR